MTELTNRCREEFEKWCDKGVFNISALHDCPDDGNPYDDWETNFAYQGWQAAWKLRSEYRDNDAKP
jgi:hypothetical protein